MTPKPPEGFASWLDWCVQNAGYAKPWRERDYAFSDHPIELQRAATAELSALRARVAELGEEYAALKAHAESVTAERDAMRDRVASAEDRCDEHVAHVVEIGDVLDAEDGETALEAAKRVMRKLEAATNLIAHTAARVAELEQQVAALADALADELKLARGWAKNSIKIHAASEAALRAAGRKT